MKKIVSIIILSFMVSGAWTQIGMGDTMVNSADRLILSDSRITLGGYGEIDFNNTLPSNGNKRNGSFDVHRMVFLTGYKFTDKLSFVTELEIEHIKEVFIEQAFIDYRLHEFVHFRAGLMLIPMGIINEYHEPVTFNGVERPNIDKYLIPTTWREIGAGFSGTIPEIGFRYQAYFVNGLSSFDNEASLSGSSGFRSGRQKGAQTTFSHPNATLRLEYFGLSKLKIGLSGYIGKTQSTLYDEIGVTENGTLARADSSVVGMGMMVADIRYKNKGFEARGQYVYANIANSSQYNAMFGTNVGSAMQGYYVEAGYDLLRFMKKSTDKKLVAFCRYENYNTHHKVSGELTQNKSYNRTDITTGLTFHLDQGVALKADFQQFRNELRGSSIRNQINFGVGVWF